MTNGEIRLIARDIIVDGAVAFATGDQVAIEKVEPNPQRPEYKYIVTSPRMQRQFQLRDEDLAAPQPLEQPPAYEPAVVPWYKKPIGEVGPSLSRPPQGPMTQPTYAQAQPGVQQYGYEIKTNGMAYALWFTFVGHRIYLRQNNPLYYFTIFGMFFWWIIDLMSIPKWVREYNSKYAMPAQIAAQTAATATYTGQMAQQMNQPPQQPMQ